MATMAKCSMCLAVLAVSCIVSTQGQGMAINPKLKMPTKFKSYTEYLKYVGMATGAIPVQPEEEKALAAEALAPGAALAPVVALQAQGGPEMLHDPNPNPTIDDWVKAYKPVDDQLNYIFEHRINKDNAREAQFQLAIAAAPLQVLVNDVTNAQAKEIGNSFQSFAKTLGLTNPLTGTSGTAPAPVAQSAVRSDGTTITASAAQAPAAGTAALSANTMSAGAGTTAAPATTAVAANPLAGLASLFGRKLLAHMQA